MKGLIYKDLTIFFKSLDKRLVLIMTGAIILIMVNGGVYAGVFASVMLAMIIGMQHTMSFASDEKVGWAKYQLAMPVNAVSVVASKYISVICTLAVSIVGSILFNLLLSAALGGFNAAVWGISVTLSLIVPLLWTGICLPLIYWFGFRLGQTVRFILIFPVFYFAKYLEEGDGFLAMADSGRIYAVAGMAVIFLFLISMMISVTGYGRKRING